MYALLVGLKELGIPSLDLWDLIFGKALEIQVYEDNEATQKVVKSGKFDKAFWPCVQNA